MEILKEFLISLLLGNLKFLPKCLPIKKVVLLSNHENHLQTIFLPQNIAY